MQTREVRKVNNQRKQFRKLLKAKGVIIAPGAFDALSARVIEQVGFQLVYLTGGGISRSWGFPDLGLMTMTENLMLISRVCDSVSIPVIADADTGYGNVLNVVRTVREYERAGVACFHLEDQVTPKRCGHYEKKNLITSEEMEGKIRAVVETRSDPDLAVIARTDARAELGLKEAIKRSNAYAKAGADIIFVEAPQSVEEIETIVKEVEVPVMVNMIKGSRTPLLSSKELNDIGVKIAIYPNECQRAAIWAVHTCAMHLLEKGTTHGFENMVDFSTREQIVGTAEWEAQADRYSAGATET
jgi:carboxyvinyl-carboxyphosphonate phosphorylmutase